MREPALFPATEPRRTGRCRSIRPSGRRCNLVLVREPWRSLGVGRECAAREGIALPAAYRPPPPHTRQHPTPQAPALFDLTLGAPMPVPRVPDHPSGHETADERLVSWDLDDAARLSLGPDTPDAADEDWHIHLSLDPTLLDHGDTLHRAVSRTQIRALALTLLAMTDHGATGDWRALADHIAGKPERALTALATHGTAV